jgi:hypothetical protein
LKEDFIDFLNDKNAGSNIVDVFDIASDTSCSHCYDEIAALNVVEDQLIMMKIQTVRSIFIF